MVNTRLLLYFALRHHYTPALKLLRQQYDKRYDGPCFLYFERNWLAGGV